MPITDTPPVLGRATEAKDGDSRKVDGAEIARRYGVIGVWVAMIVLFSILRPDTFATWGNFTTIAGSQAVLVIITLALLFPLAASEFDLSVSGTLGVALV